MKTIVTTPNDVYEDKLRAACSHRPYPTWHISVLPSWKEMDTLNLPAPEWLRMYLSLQAAASQNRPQTRKISSSHLKLRTVGRRLRLLLLAPAYGPRPLCSLFVRALERRESSCCWSDKTMQDSADRPESDGKFYVGRESSL